MGEKLAKIYEIITEKAGYEGRMKFAQMTGVSKNKASEVQDTDELIAKFKRVANEMIGGNIDKLL